MRRREWGNPIEIGKSLTDGSRVRLTANERAEHLYVAGATNVGKSRFLESLIRQDIEKWPDSRSGMLLLDPHGSVYDGTMRWLADKAFLAKRPIIPIDLREDDWVVGYNPLRQQPHIDSSVLVQSIVTAMAHVWGKANTDDTPRLEKWTSATLHALYDNKLTLAEAGYILYPEATRQRELLLQHLKNPAARGVWNQNRTVQKLDEVVESTVNRFQRFLGTEAMRTMFGQTASLDLTKALAEGHIILVSLATRHSRTEADAKLFGTLLLADLWSTAKRERDKRDNPPPFYVYLDEFQEFVTPTIARNLDQSRGFGLHFTLANQYPKQVVHSGGEEYGRHLYDSLFQNTGNKVAFRLEHPQEDVEAFARSLFKGVFDPDQIKLRLISPAVVRYNREMFRAKTEGSSDSETESSSESEGSSEQFYPQGEDEVRGTGRSSGTQSSTSIQSSSSQSSTESEGLVPELQDRTTSVQFRTLDEQLDIAMAAISAQDNRHGTGRFVKGEAPVAFRSLETPDPDIGRKLVARYREKLLRDCAAALPTADAERVLAERQRDLFAEPEPPEDAAPRRKLKRGE